MKIASLNVRGLTNPGKRSVLFDWAISEGIDVLCLQETFCTLDVVESFNKDWPGMAYHSLSDSAHSRGCAILFNSNFEFSFIDSHISSDGRRILVNIKNNSVAYCISSVYAPNITSHKVRFFKECQAWLRSQTLNELNTIVCGDFNCALTSFDRSNSKLDYNAKDLKEFIKNLNLEDSFRFKNPNAKGFTYTNASGNVKSRIDYIFHSIHLRNVNEKVYVKYVPMIPDHKAVLIQIKTENIQGKGYWKLNTQYLQNPDYIFEVKNIIKNHIQCAKNYNPSVFWEFCKIKIKHFSIEFGKAYSKKQKREINVIEKQLEKIDNCNGGGTSKEDSETLQAELKKKLDEKYLQKVNGAKVRSRIQWISESEKNIKFFQNIEQKHQSNNTIHCLEKGNGSLITDNAGIVEHVNVFYNDLYQSRNIPNPDIDGYLDKIQLHYK